MNRMGWMLGLTPGVRHADLVRSRIQTTFHPPCPGRDVIFNEAYSVWTFGLLEHTRSSQVSPNTANLPSMHDFCNFRRPAFVFFQSVHQGTQASRTDVCAPDRMVAARRLASMDTNGRICITIHVPLS